MLGQAAASASSLLEPLLAEVDEDLVAVVIVENNQLGQGGQVVAARYPTPDIVIGTKQIIPPKYTASYALGFRDCT